MADNAVAATIKRSARNATQFNFAGNVSTINFTIPLPTAAAENETYTTSNAVLPANSIILGCYLKTSTAFGGTATIALKGLLSTTVFAAAAINNATTWAVKTVTAPHQGVVATTLVPTDDRVVLTVASAAGVTVAGGVTVSVCLVIASLGSSDTVTTYTN